MISFWRIFSLEVTAFWRSKALALLLVAAAVWMFAFKYFVRGDGTAEGARELYIHYSLGGVFALTVIALIASATGTFAREREAKRLQLTLVRPVRFFSLSLAKIAALVSCGAVVLVFAAALLLFQTDPLKPCNHVLSPILASPRDEAKAMYESYMKDPETPENIRKADRRAVLRLLERKAVDHYQTIPTNTTATWNFAQGGEAIRLRFTNNFEMRQEVRGVFSSGNAALAVSNMTQAVTVIPFVGENGELKFENRGSSALMLRPRRDLNLLVRGDAFYWNLVRALMELLAALAILVSMATLLSAGLGRPVAMFVAFSMLIVGEISPAIVEEYPNELECGLVDQVGLVITRSATELARPLAALTPLSALAKAECIERGEVLRAVGFDLLLLPILLSLFAAGILKLKH